MYQNLIRCATPASQSLREAVVVIHTRCEQRFRVEFQTPADLEQSIASLLGHRQVRYTIASQKPFNCFAQHHAGFCLTSDEKGGEE
jgi:hypothetical protein